MFSVVGAVLSVIGCVVYEKCLMLGQHVWMRDVMLPLLQAIERAGAGKPVEVEVMMWQSGIVVVIE